MPEVPYSVLIGRAAKRQFMRFGTLKDVGESLGLQPAYMTKWTNGRRLENVDHLADLVERAGGSSAAMFFDLVEYDLQPTEEWLVEVLRSADPTTRERIVDVVGVMAKRPDVPLLSPHREEALRLLAQAPAGEVRQVLALLRAMADERGAARQPEE